MNLSDRLFRLRVSFLPDDLLHILHQAQCTYNQGQYERTKILLNVIEKNCHRRGIPIHNKKTAPRHVDYKKIRILYGQNGLRNIHKFIDEKI